MRLMILVVLLMASPRLWALNCSEVRQLMGLYLRSHYSFSKFDDMLSERTLDNFIRAWDPGKLYFLSADVQELKKKYAKNLDDLVVGKLDCSPIEAVLNLYAKRFSERQKYVDTLLKASHKFDFTIDEYLSIDRKAMKYGNDVAELNERWRKRIKFQYLSLKSTLDDEKVREKLKKRIELTRKGHQELNTDKVNGVFLNAFASALDPHSTYMPARDLEDFRIRTRLSLEGIGASLRSEDGFTIVVSLVKGGAAQKGGELKVGDKIVAVAQEKGEPVDVIDMDLSEVVRLIRGARGTEVRLSVIRKVADKTEKMVIPIVREKIQLVDQQAASKIIDVDMRVGEVTQTRKVGVIHLPSFYIDFEARHKRLKNYRSSSKDTKRELEKLKKQGVDAILIDLRSNGGGSLEESIKLAGLFFDRGPVVQVKTSDGDIDAFHDQDGYTFYDGPLAVLINRHSASASEIFAGAIQDYGRGIVIGDSHTFGKGTVQNLDDVAPTLGAIKVTVNQFYLPGGKTTQLGGVVADIRLRSLIDELEIGERYYDYALPDEGIRMVKHQQFNQVKPYLAQLTKRSDERVAASSDFAKVRKAIEAYRKNKDDRNRVSLKEEPKKVDKKQVSDNSKGGATKSQADLKGKDSEKPKKMMHSAGYKQPNKDGTVPVDVEKSKEDEIEDAPANAVAEDWREDIYLHETIKIVADYVQLLNKKPLATQLELPKLHEKSKEASVKE